MTTVTVARPKGPAALPPTNSKTEEFLKTIIPFRAAFDGTGFVDVIQIDKYLFVVRLDNGSINLQYKASTTRIQLQEDAALQLLAHLAK